MYSFGVDIGGSSIKIALVYKKEIKDYFTIPTNLNDSSLIIKECLEAIKEYCVKNNISESDIKGIGFGIPGNVINNKIYNCPNINLYDFKVTKEVKKYFKNVKVKCSNDANVAALAEVVNLSEYNSAVMITLGTGVGAGIVINKKIIEGFTGSAGEIGHMQLDTTHNFLCNCGLSGCLETVASANGIVRLAKYYYDDYPTLLNREDITCKEVVELAKKYDPLCSFVLDKACFYLAKAISILTITINPEVIILGGGVSEAGEILVDGIKKYFNVIAYKSTIDTNIVIAKLKNKAGMLGAALLVE